MHVTVAGCEFEVEYAAVPAELPGATARGVLWQAARGAFLLEVPDVARYRVRGGETITIDSLTDDDAEIERFLRLTPLAALFHQRGDLAFHAAAAADERGAVLLAGDSGAGKSTLLAALLQRGWTMLADELAVVRLDTDGRPRIWPAFAAVDLWPDAAEKLAVAASGSNCRRQLDAATQFAGGPLPLREILRLAVRPTAEVEVEELAGPRRLEVVNLSAYQTQIAAAVRDPVAHFTDAARLAACVPVRSLARPRGTWSVAELADLVCGAGR